MPLVHKPTSVNIFFFFIMQMGNNIHRFKIKPLGFCQLCTIITSFVCVFSYTCTPVSVFNVKVSIQCQGQHSVSRSAFNVIIQCQGQHSVSRSALIVKVSIPYQGQHSVSAFRIKVSIQCQGQHSVLMTTFSVKVTISVKVFD